MSLTLTIQEILDLAEFAGLTVAHEFADIDDLNAELTVEPCPKQGILDEETNEREHYRLVVYFSDYPEEGAQGLGEVLSVSL